MSPGRRCRHLGAALCTALLLGACATTAPLPRATSADEVPALCRALFERLDRAVTSAGVGDAGADRIDGFPWLRVTRPLASFRFEAQTPTQRAAWLSHLAAADAEARGHELANLPATGRDRLAAQWLLAATDTGLAATLAGGQDDCRRRLNARLADDHSAWGRLVTAARPRDEYRDWQRVVGLYPLTRHIVLPRIAVHQAAREEAIEAGAAAQQPRRRYAVPLPPGYRPDLQPAALERDALGIPRPTPGQRAALFAAHAPIWSVETRTDADRPGALVQGDDRPVVDIARPVEYRHWSWARFRGRVLVQLSYVLWFPQRPPEDGIDIYAGHLDGLVWRVTLLPDGRPLAYESIHPCGCYYTVFPGAGWRVRAMQAGEEPVFAPLAGPRPRSGERVVVYLEAGTHYIAGVGTEDDRQATPLAPLPLTRLRSLPLRDGGSESAFAPNGVIPSSRRLERFLLWPLGVPSPGAMRQWGTHAIAFVGKRHFDDPDLLDSLLVRDDGTASARTGTGSDAGILR